MDKKIIYRILREGLMLGYKKFQDRYFDLNTRIEFPKSEINKHPRWYKEEYTKDGKVSYYENSDGYWEKREYDKNNQLIRREDHNDEWENWEYDEDGNQIYYENSNGYWSIKEYYNNGKVIHYQNSDGYWNIKEYDEDGNEIYYEDSDGYIIDNRDRIQEGLMLQYKKRDIKYFDWDTGEEFPYEEINEHPNWLKQEYDADGNRIYWESYEGFWVKYKYDTAGNILYSEASNGNIIDNRNNIQEGLMLQYKKFPDRYFDRNTGKEFPKSKINKHPSWRKIEYDADGNKIYYEDSDGYWVKREYDTDGNLIYRETCDGYWSKREYDIYGNVLYYEDNSGYWVKYEYDADGNRIYSEDSDGFIRDNRDQIQEGLMLPYKKYQNYLSGIATVLVNQDWDTRYDAAQQRENRFNIKKALVEIFKDPNVMVRVADLYEWSDGNNGFISFNNLNHYITDIGFKSFADDPMLFFDMDKLKQHILYGYASIDNGNLRRGERYRDYKYDPNDDFDW